MQATDFFADERALTAVSAHRGFTALAEGSTEQVDAGYHSQLQISTCHGGAWGVVPPQQ
jgi:hypothetical protein